MQDLPVELVQGLERFYVSVGPVEIQQLGEDAVKAKENLKLQAIGLVLLSEPVDQAEDFIYNGIDVIVPSREQEGEQLIQP